MIHTNHFSTNSIYFITSFPAEVLIFFVVVVLFCGFITQFRGCCSLMSHVLMMFKKIWSVCWNKYYGLPISCHLFFFFSSSPCKPSPKWMGQPAMRLFVPEIKVLLGNNSRPRFCVRDHTQQHLQSRKMSLLLLQFEHRGSTTEVADDSNNTWCELMGKEDHNTEGFLL